MLSLPKNLKVNDIIEVVWEDAWGSSGWQSKQSIIDSTPVEVKSIGYFVGWSKNKELRMVDTIDKSDYCNGTQSRPKAMIRSIRKLK